MTEDHSAFAQRFKAFRPSKTLWFWSSVGVAIATMVVGFGFGGWVTGGTAREMAEDAASNARAQLVASVCVERYTAGASFADRLSKLKEASSWDREEMIEEGKWTALPGITEPVADAAELCADRLAEMEVPAAPAAPASETASGEPETAS